MRSLLALFFIFSALSSGAHAQSSLAQSQSIGINALNFGPKPGQTTTTTIVSIPKKQKPAQEAVSQEKEDKEDTSGPIIKKPRAKAAPREVLEQKTLEQNPKWKNIYGSLERLAKEKDEDLAQNGLISMCDPSDIQRLIQEPSDFEERVNYFLPQISSPSPNKNSYEVGTVANLDNLKPNNNWSIDTVLPMNWLGQYLLNNQVPNEQLKNAQRNTSAWLVPKKITDQKIIASPIAEALSGELLRTQSLKTMTNYIYLYNDPSVENKSRFIKSALALYARNRMLCLYGPFKSQRTASTPDSAPPLIPTF